MSASRLGVLIAALAGCGGSIEGGSDGGTDARIDAPFASRVCDPDRPMPAEPTSNGSLEGDWRVEWTCVEGCVLRRPGLTYSPRLTIEATTLRFSNDLCPDCKADVTGAVTIDGCIDINGWTDFDSQCRFSYRVCEMEGELNGTITWKEPGVSEQVWVLRGTR
jgi:hypothetical protein